MKILTSRIYDDAPAGYRTLVDRLWPRGISRQKAGLDEWCKQLAPSPELRQWFNHEPAKWPDFQKRYAAELKANRAEAAALLNRAGKGPLVLLYGAKDTEHNQALVLQTFLESMK
jgi:uncharacterized protein YeaO (DUF488 family)